MCVCEYRKSSLENSFVCSILHVCSPLPLRILNELTYIARFQLKVTESVAWQEVRGREEKIRPRRKAERQRGREVVDGTPGLLDTLAGLRSLAHGFSVALAVDPSSLWDWGWPPSVLREGQVAPFLHLCT